MNNYLSQGPGKGAVSLLRRIATTALSGIQSRLELAALELEEEKQSLLNLLIMVGVALLFLIFGLATLLILICCAIDDPHQRFILLAWLSGGLLGIALLLMGIIVYRAKHTTFLAETRKVLKADRASLNREEVQHDEQ